MTNRVPPNHANANAHAHAHPILQLIAKGGGTRVVTERLVVERVERFDFTDEQGNTYAWDITAILTALKRKVLKPRASRIEYTHAFIEGLNLDDAGKVYAKTLPAPSATPPTLLAVRYRDGTMTLIDGNTRAYASWLNSVKYANLLTLTYAELKPYMLVCP